MACAVRAKRWPETDSWPMWRTVRPPASVPVARSCCATPSRTAPLCAPPPPPDSAPSHPTASGSIRYFPLIVAGHVLADFHRQMRPVVEYIFTLEGVGLLPVTDVAHRGRPCRLLAFRRPQIPGHASGHLLRRAPQQRADSLVEADHRSIQVGFLVRDGRPVEKIAVPTLAHQQVAFPLPQQIGGVLQLIAERGDFVRPQRHRLERGSEEHT